MLQLEQKQTEKQTGRLTDKQTDRQLLHETAGKDDNEKGDIKRQCKATYRANQSEKRNTCSLANKKRENKKKK